MYANNRKRAFVTGAGSGFGRALSLALAGRGYKVAATDLNANSATETALMIKESGGQAESMKVDVTIPYDLESGAERFFKEWGGVDLLINNAGVAVVGKVHEVPVNDWQFIVNINLLSVVYGCRAFVPRMLQQGGGHIMNTASLAGIASLPEMGPYNVTKAAVIALSETLRGELRSGNIGVTAVCPSFFKTGLMDNARGPETMKNIGHQALQSGVLTAEQIAEMALRDMERNRLYSIPHRTGRMLWRTKRLVPEVVYNVLGRSDLEKDGARMVTFLNKLG